MVKAWVAALAGVLAGVLACSEPEQTGFPGLSADVDVAIDSDGIPHIYGATDADVFYAAGYQMATDRLLQMDLLRRRAHGRWSEVFGVERFEDDRIARTFRWRDLGRASAEVMRERSPETWGVIVAWTAGVNRRIAEVRAGDAPLPYGFGPGELDIQPEPWEDADALVVGRMIGFANDNRVEQELFATLLTRLRPEVAAAVPLPRPMFPAFILPPDERPAPASGPAPAAPRPAAVTATPAEEAAAAAALLRLHDSLGSLRVLGSNNWAVAGSLTASGRPIVANDPHQRLESPSLMYAQHLNSADAGGTLDVAGFAFAATPGVQLGHNRYVIWSATTNFGDTMDIWEVELLDDAVRIAGEVVPGVVREEVIAIRGEPPVSLFFLDIPGRGVVLPADLAPLPVARPGYALLFDWTGFDVGLTRELLEFNRATSLDEFDAAIDRLGAGFNFIAADAAGIGYRVGHVIPDRGPPAGKPEPWLVMDGAVAASYWTGAALPPERLPHSRDPARGWLASANNDPFGFTANGRVDDDPWYYGGLFEPGFRATRIEAELTRLAERGAVDVADMQALQRDVRSPLADELVPMALDVHARAATDDALAALRDRPDVDRAVAALAGWDRRMARDSAGAVAFHAFVHLLAREVLRDDIGVFFEPAVELAPETVLKVTALTMLGVYGDELVPEGRDAALARALVATAEWLDVRFGASPYALADAHATVFAAPFSGRLELPAVPTQGGEDTIDVSPSRTFDGVEPADRWDSSYGPLFRLVGTFDEDGAPSVQYCAAPGQSADPDSAHAADLVADWAEGRYRPLRTRRADVEADATWYTLPAGAR